ncbi:MAG TPA: transcriptional regulator MntR [Methylomirabilota bacterium]|nr:transcriptional regulator MntR [Methylomirabilota bacterium]
MKADPWPSATTEDYLERIHELILEKGYARAVEIAAALRIRQPSVTAMVQKLAESGYLNYEKYRGITLTEKGARVAAAIRERHMILERFFVLLNLPPTTRDKDIEGIEHCLSPETLASLAGLVDFFESRPDVLREFARLRQRTVRKRED